MVFEMRPQKPGRILYLLLCWAAGIVVAPVAMLLKGFLVDLPKLKPLLMLIPAIAIIASAYLLILRKNHILRVEGNRLTETTWKCIQKPSISVHQISHVRRNLLREIVLLDENGKVLLTVENYMTNFDQFEAWLQKHNKL